MGIRELFGAVLIVAGLGIGAVGLRQAELTAGEKAAGGVMGFAAALDPTGNQELKRKARELENAGFRRALPYYVGGGVVLAAGAGVLLVGRKRG